MNIFFNQKKESNSLSIVNFCLAIMLILFYIIFNYLRLGLENAWLETAKISVIPLFFVLYDFNYKKSVNYILKLISIILIISGIIFFDLIPPDFFFICMLVFTIISFAKNVFFVFNNYNTKTIISSIFFTLIITLYIPSQIIANGFQDPLFELSFFNSSLFVDNIFHLNLVSLYQTYGEVTQGIMGNQLLNYHVGSHIVCNGFSDYFNIDSIISVNSWILLFLVPIMIRAQIGFVITIIKYFVTPEQVYIRINTVLLYLAFCTCLLYTGLFGYEVNWALRIPYANLESFSYPASLIILFSAFHLIYIRIIELSHNKISYLIDLLILALIILMGAFKISNLLVTFPVYFVFIFFHPNYNKIWVITKAIFSALIVYLLYFAYITDAEQLDIQFIHYIKTYLWKNYFIGCITPFILPFILLYIAIRKFKNSNIEFSAKMGLLALFAAGLIPGVIFKFPGSLAGYFWDIARQIAFTLILGLSVKYIVVENYFKSFFKKSILTLLALNFAFTYLFDSYTNYKKILTPKIDICGFSPLGNGYAGLLSKIKNDENKVFKEKLFQLKTLPVSIKKISRLYFEEGSFVFNDTMLVRPWASSLYPQAITGISAIDLRPAFVEGIDYKNIGYGLSFFSKRKNENDFLDINEEIIKAKQMNLSYIFYFDKFNNMKTIKL